jgi:integrase
MSEISSLPPLDMWISAWLAHQRALGRGYDGEAWVLGRLRRFIATIPAPDLDSEGFDLWCASFQDLSATTRRGRQRMVRKFCLYRQRTEPECYVPDPLYFVRLRPYRGPVIVGPEHIAGMLGVADRLVCTPSSPLLSSVMRLAVVLLYTAGLRRGELVRLTLKDVEPKTGLLRIHESKFHKSRLVPLSREAGEELLVYLKRRLVRPHDITPEAPLLCHGRGGYTGAGMRQAIDRLFVAAKVVDDEGRRPRVHDLRHSFAVGALTRWYREGADVQTNLTKLAMYMGHVSIVSTAHYLHFVPTLRELASDRFEAAFGGLVGEFPA